jgi:uncharacterized protein
MSKFTVGDMTTEAEMRGRVALITGASTGIGAAIAERLASNGAHLVLVARTATTLNETAARLREQYGVTAHALPMDLASAGGPQLLAEKLAGQGIDIELLVNGAGASATGLIAESDPARLRALIDLNAVALTELTALLLPAMINRGHGSIINIASTGAYVPTSYLAVYSASKAYVLSFTQALWAETSNSGVRVVAVSPGPTQTPMNPVSNAMTRQPQQVAATALRALKKSGPAVIDGKFNALTSFVFSRLLPGRLSASIARSLLEKMQAGTSDES